MALKGLYQYESKECSSAFRGLLCYGFQLKSKDHTLIDSGALSSSDNTALSSPDNTVNPNPNFESVQSTST